MAKRRGKFQLSSGFHFKDEKMEADDIAPTLILQKLSCFPAGKRCYRKIALQLSNRVSREFPSLGTVHLYLEGTLDFHASLFPFVLCLLKLVQVVSCV